MVDLPLEGTHPSSTASPASNFGRGQFLGVAVCHGRRHKELELDSVVRRARRIVEHAKVRDNSYYRPPPVGSGLCNWLLVLESRRHNPSSRLARVLSKAAVALPVSDTVALACSSLAISAATKRARPGRNRTVVGAGGQVTMKHRLDLVESAAEEPPSRRPPRVPRRATVRRNGLELHPAIVTLLTPCPSLLKRPGTI